MAGVSITTVSNALNNRASAMSEETLERIQRAIRTLDYRPSGVARGLVTHHTATIGVVVAEIDTPLFLQALHPIEPAARRAGYNVLIINACDVAEEREAVEVLLEKEVNGVIFLSTSTFATSAHIAPLREANVPVVFVNRPSDDEGFDTVDWDNSGAIESLVAHLARLGHRRIALLQGPPGRRSSAERLDGYRRALAAHDLEYRADYLPSGDFTLSDEVWARSTLDLLAVPSPPTAIIASDDIVAAAIMKVVQRTGRRIPDDLSIVGVDDQHFGAYLNPALTTVRLPVAKAGARAIALILQRMGGRAAAADHILLPCPLVVRESCGAQ